MNAIDAMSLYEQARWCALIDAVNLIGDECDERGKDFEDVVISPIDVKAYIERSCDKITKDLENEYRRDMDKGLPVPEAIKKEILK